MRSLLMMMLLCVVAACQPRQQAFEAPKQQARLEADRLVASDGAALPMKRWLPDGRVKAVVLGLHGFNDYSNAFTIPAPYLNKQGIALYAYDQRGFGGAAEPGIWGNRENLVRDVREALSLLKSRYPNTPLLLLGESMGGAVSIAACAEAPGCPQADGVMLVAPAVWGGKMMPDWHRVLLWLSAHTLPGVKLTGEGLDILASDNIEMLRALGRDPLVIKGTRVDAIYGLVGLMDEAYEKVGGLHQPVLLLYGAHDQVIPAGAIYDAASRMKAPLTAALYPDGWHMLLRDLGRETVLRDMSAWALKPGQKLPSGHTVDDALIHGLKH